MSTVALGASLLVGAAFVLAGASKLAAVEQWAADAGALGAPGWTVPIVPWAELAIGAALGTRLAVPIPSIAALVLLAVFTVVLARHLRSDSPPSCACFGAWSSSPVGVGHVVRNVALAALAVLSMW